MIKTGNGVFSWINGKRYEGQWYDINSMELVTDRI